MYEIIDLLELLLKTFFFLIDQFSTKIIYFGFVIFTFTIKGLKTMILISFYLIIKCLKLIYNAIKKFSPVLLLLLKYLYFLIFRFIISLPDKINFYFNFIQIVLKKLFLKPFYLIELYHLAKERVEQRYYHRATKNGFLKEFFP